MNDITFPLAVGFGAGMIAMLFLFEVAVFWRTAVLPLVRRWRYQGVKIAGRWKGLGAGVVPVAGEWSEVALSLRQDAHRLTGQMIVRHHSATASFALDMQVVGQLREDRLCLALSPAGDPLDSSGSALLEVEEGRALHGQLLYRSPLSGTVDVVNLSVYRAESLAMPRLHPAGARLAVPA